MKKNLFFFAAMYFSLIANAQIKIEGVSDIRKLVDYSGQSVPVNPVILCQ